MSQVDLFYTTRISLTFKQVAGTSFKIFRGNGEIEGK